MGSPICKTSQRLGGRWFDPQLSWEPSAKFSTRGDVAAAGTHCGSGRDLSVPSCPLRDSGRGLPRVSQPAVWFLLTGATRRKSVPPAFVSGYRFMSGSNCPLSHLWFFSCSSGRVASRRLECPHRLPLGPSPALHTVLQCGLATGGYRPSERGP